MTQKAEDRITFKIGILLFVVSAGIPALELTGFGSLFELTFKSAITISAIGGAIAGMLISLRPLIAGFVGGGLAGPLGLLGLIWYTENRESVYHIELIIAQGIASTPGILVGYGLYKLLGRTRDNETSADVDEQPPMADNDQG